MSLTGDCRIKWIFARKGLAALIAGTLSGRLGNALGQLAGESPAVAANNHSLTEFSGGGTVPGVELQTSPNTIPTVTGHFYAVTADYAAVDYNGGGAGCDKSDPMITLSLIGGTTVLPAGTGLDPCTAPGNKDILIAGNNYRVASLVSGALQWTGGAIMGVQQVNTQADVNGNDGATDNIKIVDVTPAMDKSFSPATIPQGGVSQLTFTITNTSELDAKNGWTFTDTLAPGLTIADNNASTSCPSGVVAAPSGGNTVGVTGNLAQGMASCTVTVNVTASAVGTYPNGPGNVSSNGLTPPGGSTLTVVPVVDLSVTKTASPDPYVPGMQLSYTIVVSNAGPSDAIGVAVSDPLPPALAGAGFSGTWTATAAPTKCGDAFGFGDIDTTDDIAAGGHVTFKVTGTVPTGTTGTLASTARVTPPHGAVDPGCDACRATVTDPRAGMIIPTDLGYWQKPRPALPVAVVLLFAAGGLGIVAASAMTVGRRRRRETT